MRDVKFDSGWSREKSYPLLKEAANRIEELELEVIASKPLYSRRQLEAKIAALTEALEGIRDMKSSDRSVSDYNRGWSDGRYSAVNLARKALE